MAFELIIACIPAYNEERDLGPVVVKTSKFVDKVIVCDDGSTDLTSEIASRLGCDLIVHKKRLGKGAALRDLFEKALSIGGEIIITLDGDGQHYPDDIPRLIAPVLAGTADIVIGSRFSNKGNSIPLHRAIGNNVMTSFTNLLSSESFKGLSDSQSGFRAYSRKVLTYVKVSEQGMGVDSEILISASSGSFNVVEVPISVSYNGHEGSTLNPVHHSFDVFYSLLRIASEQKPLVYFGLPGVIMILGGLIMGFRVLSIFLETRSVAIGSAFISVGLIVIGFLATTTAVVLQVILNERKRL
ncbi:MAG: glycosyltransferase family 2 protein [Thaumarchaeota archaeon]|nr:glycosyltransferase family 2 protein [Nitrososphaerota archaeon]MCL5318557.1 glycosyltransferase family 2 protein [Nitrososphaerota archaeon]